MNKGFDETWLEQLKAKNDIVTVMSQYLTLQQKGKNFWTCCPFHNEKTPSMAINPYEQYYHCFGCKEHGDVISFIQKMESCDFITAVEILAKNANMEIPSYSLDNNIQEKKKTKETVLKLLDEAYKHYEENLYLKTSTKAQDYVKKRNLTKRDLDNFHIGYAKSWTDMIAFLKTKGFSYKDMQNAGVAETKDGNYYDMMGERLVFPIFNLRDECIGFSARSLVPTDYAKYKNSPNTIVFDKSRNLFAINSLRKLKQDHKLDYIIIAEGQLDVIALHRAGFTNCVACLGTALTPQHVKMLKTLCDNVIVSLDGDGAGQKATIRTIDTLVDGGMNVKAIKIPDNMDPDEFLKANGKEAYQALLDNALDYIEFKIYNKLEQFDLSKLDQKAKFVTTCLEIVNSLKTFSEKQVYLEVIKKLTNVPIDVLKRDLIDRGSIPQSTESKEVDYFENAEVKAIKFILASLCYKKDYANYNFDLEKYIVNSSYKKLYLLLKNYHNKNEKFLISNLFDNFDLDNEPAIKDLIDYNFDNIESPNLYYNECLWKIRENYLKNQINNLLEQSKAANDGNERLKILNEINEIQKKLRNKVLED